MIRPSLRTDNVASAARFLFFVFRGTQNARHWVRAVLIYRSKFSDCLAGAVLNSYSKLDLLWDNVIAGPWGWPRSTVLAQVPARHPACDGSGGLRYAKRVNF